MSEKIEGYYNTDYQKRARDIVAYAKAQISSYNFNPNKNAIWDMPKDEESLFEVYIAEAIADRLKATVMDKTPACAYFETNISDVRVDAIPVYFATIEDAYRFSGWYAAILGYYKESARARVNVLR